MQCEELVTYLSDYIDQELDEDLREDAQQHLSTCHNCRVVLDTTQKMIFLYRQTGTRNIPVDRRDKLLGQIQGAFRQRQRGATKETDEENL